MDHNLGICALLCAGALLFAPNGLKCGARRAILRHPSASANLRTLACNNSAKRTFRLFFVHTRYPSVSREKGPFWGQKTAEKRTFLE